MRQHRAVNHNNPAIFVADERCDDIAERAVRCPREDLPALIGQLPMNAEPHGRDIFLNPLLPPEAMSYGIEKRILQEGGRIESHRRIGGNWYQPSFRDRFTSNAVEVWFVFQEEGLNLRNGSGRNIVIRNARSSDLTRFSDKLL